MKDENEGQKEWNLPSNLQIMQKLSRQLFELRMNLNHNLKNGFWLLPPPPHCGLKLRMFTL